MSIQTRFQGADYMQLIPHLTITIIGNGGIGSWLGIGLGALAPKSLYNYEFDTVEQHNLGGQLYSTDHVTMAKDEAFCENLRVFRQYDNVTNLGMFKPDSEVTPIVFCAVDDNRVRREIYDSWYKMAVANNWEHTITNSEGEEIKLPYLLIDGRMSFAKYDVYLVTQESAENHGKFFIPKDKEVAEDDCATKTNPMVGMICGGMMLQRFTNKLSNVSERIKDPELDFDILSSPWRSRHDLAFNIPEINQQCPDPTIAPLQ